MDPRLCEAHALCIDIAPEVFDLDDNIAAVSAESPDPMRHDDVDAAIAACPRQAISWVDAPLIPNFGRPTQ